MAINWIEFSRLPNETNADELTSMGLLVRSSDGSMHFKTYRFQKHERRGLVFFGHLLDIKIKNKHGVFFTGRFRLHVYKHDLPVCRPWGQSPGPNDCYPGSGPRCISFLHNELGPINTGHSQGYGWYACRAQTYIQPGVYTFDYNDYTPLFPGDSKKFEQTALLNGQDSAALAELELLAAFIFHDGVPDTDGMGYEFRLEFEVDGEPRPSFFWTDFVRCHEERNP